jgi:CDP-glycerol glycerophosphotransferase (TagB/SpsB family)
MMTVMNGLFEGDVEKILGSRLKCYPVYVYCFNDILNRGLGAELDAERPFRTSASDSVQSVSPKFSKIRPYLRSLFRTKHRVQEAEIVFVSRYRPTTMSGIEGLKTDYLFNPVIDEIFRATKHLKVVLISVGGQAKPYTDRRVRNLSLFNFMSWRLSLTSIFRSSLLYFKYKRTARRLSDNQRKLLRGFFSASSLLFCNLFDLSLSEAIRELNPRVIVANDDTMTFKPYVASHAKLIVLQSASINESTERYRVLMFSDFLEDALFSDYFCVSGLQSKSVKERYLKDTKEILITGQPRFDSLANADKLYDASKIRAKFGLASDRKILLWATDSGLPLEETRKSISNVYRAASSVENVQLVVKLHPAESQVLLYEQDHQCTPIIVKGNQPIGELLYVCNAIITKSSTSAIEAAILKRPVIVLNLSGKPDPVPYVEGGIAIGVHKAEELGSVIKKVLYDREVQEKLARGQEKFVYEHAYLQDGKASKRVSDLIIHSAKE